MRNEGSLSESQKMFLQSIMHLGYMDSAMVKQTYQNCRERFEESSAMEELKDFLKEINAKIRSLDMEVKKGFDEDLGTPCYICVNTVDNEFLLGSGKYTLRQMDYFKVLLRLIVMSDDGCVSTVDALNAVEQLKFKMTMQDAAELIKKHWTFTDKWLKGVTPLNTSHDQSVETEDAEEEMENENNMITLGTRAIVELERYIRDTFTDCVKDCNICNRLCIRGLICEHCDCHVHAGCVKSYISKQKSQIPSCPNKECGKSRPELLQYRKSSRSSQSQPGQSQASQSQRSTRKVR